jgi:hypothetical protein
MLFTLTEEEIVLVLVLRVVVVIFMSISGFIRRRDYRSGEPVTLFLLYVSSHLWHVSLKI